MALLTNTINVINLDPGQLTPWVHPHHKQDSISSRFERIANIARQSKLHGFNVRFWEGMNNHKNPWTNISRAFKKIVQWAKDSELQHVIIGEDDLQFTAPGAWEYYHRNVPRHFDLYLGGIYAGQLEGNRVVNGYSGHTLITVHKNCYDLMLSANENDHLDRWMGNFAHDRKYIVSMPFVVMQMGGFSHNKKRVQYYDSYHSNWEYFT